MFNLKIVKKSDYNIIKTQNSLLNRRMIHVHQSLDSLSENLDVLEKTVRFKATDLTIRSAIFGNKGSGRTTLLKKTLIPQLKNFFIIDFFDVYPEFDEHRNRKGNISKRRYKTENYGLMSIKDKQIIWQEIEAHSDDVIIIDSAEILPPLFLKNLLQTLSLDGYNYILVFGSDIHQSLIPNLPFKECFNQGIILSELSKKSDDYLRQNFDKYNKDGRGAILTILNKEQFKK